MSRYVNETKDTILNRMKAKIADDIDKRQGSIVHDLLSPGSIEKEMLYAELDNVLAFGFADSSYGQFLEQRTKELGIYRKQARKATGSVTFTGEVGTVIAIGTKVSTDESEPLYFLTTEEKTLDSIGEATIPVKAEAAGANGNVAQQTITLTLGDLVGVTSVINSTAFTGGVDEEEDNALLERYLEKVQTPATSGNKYQYRNWAKSVAGVFEANVYPIWNGPGTVKVVLLGDNGRSPDQTIIQNTSAYIEENRPIGASVTVTGATEVSINVSIDVVLTAGYTLTQGESEIVDALNGYFQEIAFVDPIIRYNQIVSLVLNTRSILDFTNLTLNGGTSNLTLSEEEVAIVGTVTL